jgi:superfamily II DNA or RNA helicase
MSKSKQKQPDGKKQTVIQKPDNHVEFNLMPPDKDKGERQPYHKDDSAAPDDLEKKFVFLHSLTKQHKISIDKTSTDFPVKLLVDKETLEVYDQQLVNISCSCHKFYDDELNYCEHIACFERLSRFFVRDELLKEFTRQVVENKKATQYRTFLFYDTLKQQYQVVGKGHLEETLLLFKEFKETENKKVLLDNNEVLSVYLSKTAKKKLESETDPSKMDSLNSYLYNKKLLDSVDTRNIATKELLAGIDLFDYQKDIFVDCLAAKRSIIALIPGAGKTALSIGVYEHLWRNNPNFSMFVVSPNTLKTQWAKEIKRFTGKTAKMLDSQEAIKAWDCSGIGIINYQMMTRYIDDLLGEGNRTRRIADMMIVDEVQTVKNADTKTWRAISKLKSDYFLALSGTIIENRLDDLYNVMKIVAPNALGPKWKFDRDFQKVLAATKHKITYGGIKNVDKLHEKIKNSVFMISPDELNKRLTAIEHKTENVVLSEEQSIQEADYRAKADILLRKGMEKPLRPHEKMLLNAYLLKARQACTCIELIDKKPRDYYEPKIEEIRKIFENHCVKQNEKIVLFSEWTEMLSIIERMVKVEFPNINYVVYSGDVATKLRPKLVEQFKTDPTTMLFLSSDAGGTGLDGLQLVSNVVVHTEIPWNPAKIDQRNGRLHRTLQKKPVTAYYIVSSTGTEAKMQEKLAQKREIRKAALGFDRSNEEVVMKASEIKDILKD